ncbi:hypothetical protein BGX26_010952 [Mortierella sp. AD094]|nr:hypothetical protein BGX26_010952 [Mortierella sp. AD094]
MWIASLIPLRIEHHPDATLEVVMRSTGDRTNDTSGNRSSKLNGTSPPAKLNGTSHPEAESSNSQLRVGEDQSRADAFQERSRHPSHLSNSYIRPSNIGLTERSATKALESQPSPESFPQVSQATGIMTAMDQHFNNLKIEMQKIKGLKTHLVQMQQNIRQVQHQVEERQQEVTQMQKRLLGPLAAIQNRAQALLSKTYELHENSLPRLFIILPYPEKRQDTFGRLISDQFRLFFLCECRKHTIAEGIDIPHEIHLAIHEGYHILKPAEFFEKFSSYILTVMQMFKYGITTAGFVVPPLENFNIFEGMDEIQKYLNLTEGTIRTMVDESISFLEQRQKKTAEGVEATDQIAVDELGDLEYPDLSRLKSYLRVRERSSIPGNLYRIVTAESHVEWVCADHYRTIYSEDDIRVLKEIIEVSRGNFLEKLGSSLPGH